LADDLKKKYGEESIKKILKSSALYLRKPTYMTNDAEAIKDKEEEVITANS